MIHLIHRKRSPFSSPETAPFCPSDISPDRGISIKGKAFCKRREFWDTCLTSSVTPWHLPHQGEGYWNRKCVSYRKRPKGISHWRYIARNRVYRKFQQNLYHLIVGVGGFRQPVKPSPRWGRWICRKAKTDEGVLINKRKIFFTILPHLIHRKRSPFPFKGKAFVFFYQ